MVPVLTQNNQRGDNSYPRLPFRSPEEQGGLFHFLWQNTPRMNAGPGAKRMEKT